MIRSPMPRALPSEPKPPRGARMRKCSIKECRAPFAPMSMTHKVCGPACALIYAKAQSKLREDKADRARKVAMKSRAQWLKEAQTAVNALVRARDSGDGCISCERPATWPGQWHASHFKSVGSSSALRFDLANIHKACSICNNHLSGNIAAYAPRLVDKIGAAEFDRLNGPQEIVKHSIEDAQRIKAWATAQLKQLKEAA